MAELELPCTVCWTRAKLRTEATDFECGTCLARYSFVACADCSGVGQVRHQTVSVIGGSTRYVPDWVCSFCRRSNRARPLFGKAPRPVSSQRRLSTLERHRMVQGDRDVRVVGGFTHVGGVGFDIAPGSVCSLVGLLEGVLVAVEIGPGPQGSAQLVRYPDMTGVELGGGAQRGGGGFVGGGFGLSGALEGMVVASVLNTLTSRTKVNTLLRIGSTHGEMLLHHGELAPDGLRTALALVFNRLAVTKHARTTSPATPDATGPVDRLERLAKLHAEGLLTDKEFALAKRGLLERD